MIRGGQPPPDASAELRHRRNGVPVLQPDGESRRQRLILSGHTGVLFLAVRAFSATKPAVLKGPCSHHASAFTRSNCLVCYGSGSAPVSAGHFDDALNKRSVRWRKSIRDQGAHCLQDPCRRWPPNSNQRLSVIWSRPMPLQVASGASALA